MVTLSSKSTTSPSNKVDAALMINRSKKRVTQLSADLALLGYVMSHDMLTPIREMDMIVKKMGESSDQGAAAIAEFQASAQKTVDKMLALNTAVLEFICSGNTTMKSKVVDSNEVIQGVLNDLSKSIKKTKAQITCSKMPELLGRHTQFNKLFYYLIDNAIKFRSKRPLEIHIAVAKEGNSWLFSVKDNGIGVAEEYLGIIFVLFQRGPDVEKIPGIGAGLTLSKKIVEYFNGEMWMESELGQGSTIFFTLPIDSMN